MTNRNIRKEFEDKQLPTFTELVLNHPLYRQFDIELLELPPEFPDKRDYFRSLRYTKERCDLYCVECNKERTFSRTEKFNTYSSKRHNLIDGDDEVFLVEMTCTKDHNHQVYFLFRVKNKKLSKIGQHPSGIQLSSDKIKKYKILLGEEKFSELSKAISLASHGIGIGSFVYLRRIFEDLISNAYDMHRKELECENFEQLKMENKILLLKNHLPDFLVENRKIYSILSAGIHFLTEEQCLKSFKAIEMGIELILDEQIVLEKKLKKTMAASQALNVIQKEIKG